MENLGNGNQGFFFRGSNLDSPPKVVQLINRCFRFFWKVGSVAYIHPIGRKNITYIPLEGTRKLHWAWEKENTSGCYRIPTHPALRSNQFIISLWSLPAPLKWACNMTRRSFWQRWCSVVTCQSCQPCSFFGDSKHGNHGGYFVVKMGPYIEVQPTMKNYRNPNLEWFKIPEPKTIVDLVKTYSFNGLWTLRGDIYHSLFGKCIGKPFHTWGTKTPPRKT